MASKLTPVPASVRWSGGRCVLGFTEARKTATARHPQREGDVVMGVDFERSSRTAVRVAVAKFLRSPDVNLHVFGMARDVMPWFEAEVARAARQAWPGSQIHLDCLGGDSRGGPGTVITRSVRVTRGGPIDEDCYGR